MTDNWKKVLVKPETFIKEVLEIITNESFRIAIVVDDKNNLIGTITDGDIRRAILKNKNLDSQAKEVMNSNPLSALPTSTTQEMAQVMLDNDILCLPVLEKGKVVNLETLNDVLKTKQFNNAVFLMAGGFGRRLQPLTHKTPKPLLKVGEKPILEIILERLVKSGFHRFYISTHYMPESVMEHFGDGKKWGVDIKYIHEETPLGTGGALGLLPKDEIHEPLLLMNGDLLTNIDFKSLMKYHQETGGYATVCVHEYKHTVPFGVIESEGIRVSSIEEKPTYNHFINAGIYVLSEEIIKDSLSNEHIDVPTLLKKQISSKKEINIFPVHEYWLDIGRMGDYKKANKDVSDL